MHQNVPENIEEKVVPSQVLKQDIIIDRVKAATMKVPLIISELNTKAVIDTGAEATVLSDGVVRFEFNLWTVSSVCITVFICFVS